MYFKTWQDYQLFANKVRFGSRYIFDDKMEHFLNVVSNTSKEKKKYIEKGACLWRAQKGSNSATYTTNTNEEIGVKAPFKADRMKPPFNHATEGRANPKGIPVLYLSDDKDTAMSEVRPWMGAIITVSRFRTKNKLSVIDCSTGTYKRKLHFENPSPEIREKEVWASINAAFSKPVDKSDNIAEYAPTQILAELFRENGFDGIAYKSSLNKSLNIVLFDLENAKAEKGILCELKCLQFEFEEHASPYNSIRYK